MYKPHKAIFKPDTYLLPPGGRYPVARPLLPSIIADPLSSLDGPRGSGHPDPDSFAAPQYNQLPRSRSTSRSNAPCHGFHDSSR
jgi:hypothetical protein